MKEGVKIGVLDIQGSVAEHMEVLRKIGLKPRAVKTKRDLNKVSGLIIPGGESTTIGKLLKLYGLDEEIKKRASQKALRVTRYPLLSVWGTCAGAILLAKKVGGGMPDVLGLLEIEVERNAYGRQLDSFETEVDAPEIGLIKAVFIRAPQIKKTSARVKILAEYEGSAIMVRQENLLATTFHTELTDDASVHKYFVSLVQNYAGKKSKN